MRQRIWHLAIPTLFLLLLAVRALAAPLAETQIPQPLKPWKDWVLLGHEDRLCPADGDTRLCAWPSALRLELAGGGGRFNLSARLYAPGWLGLPGEESHWPQEVRANGKPAPVLLHEERPSIYLPAGDYRIEGQFVWQQLPESLPVPDDSGLITLLLNGKPLAAQLDSEQRLALGQNAASAAPEDNVELKVYRKIEDSIPLTLTTHLKLQVSGKLRETTLGPVLPAGFLPLAMSGNLPARLSADGKLTLQLRPGVWTLEVTARAPGPVTRLTLPAQAEPWPAEEVWSFQSRPELRVVDISGAPGMDPRQTQMPEDWQALPAYLVAASGSLELTEKQRGAATAEANQLNLQRQLWLDSDGRGYTLQDQLSGSLRSQWRLDAEAPIGLGQVLVNGEPQLITRQGKGNGVEVRSSELNLSADSRIEGAARRLPVAGWNVDLQNVQLQLHLPPGWRLFAAPGTDNVPDSWLSRWTLLDLFVVLIASIAALRLFGPVVAGLTLITLALTWQEPGAPRWLWINLILVIALARALPASLRDSRLAAWLTRYRWVAALLLVLAAVPFGIQQVRLGLYPQLEQDEPATSSGLFASKDEAPAAEEAVDAAAAPAPAAEAEAEADSASSSRRYDLYSGAGSKLKAAKQDMLRLDPSIITQTGPGLPQWQGHSVALSWSGSVSPGQQYSLWLQPPWLTRTLEFLHCLLIAALLAAWMGLRPGQMPTPPWRKVASATAPLLLLALLLPSPQGHAAGEVDQTTEAEVSPEQTIVEKQPATTLLDTLRERLLAAPDCAPDCIEIPRLRLSVAGERLDLRLTVDAEAAGALPLPVPPRSSGEQARGWQAETVLLDGQPATLRRDGSGTLWASVPAGRHEVLISGSLKGLSQLQIPLPRTPRLVTSETGGWQLGGLGEQGQASSTLQLTAPAEAMSSTADAGQQAALKPLLRITRTLTLGQDWDVQTTVERIGASQSSTLLSLPLLPGEAVTGAGITVSGGRAQIGLAPGQNSLSWSSRLAIAPALRLSAMPGNEAYEVWRFRTGPLWHVDFKGLPPVQQVEEGAWLLSFQPWPGEALELSISRPGGAPGRSLTLDQSQLKLQPTTRATETTLTLQLRSSQGGQHRLQLPPQTRVSALTIDGQPATPRLEGNKLVLPLHPGSQTIVLTLRSSEGLKTLQHSPAIDLGLSGVNTSLNIAVPEDRWVLFVGGPRQGPAVLFWGVLLVLFAIAYGLGRVHLTPLRARDWALLMIGLSQLPVFGAAVVVLWLIALGARGRADVESWGYRRFDAMQIGLVLLSVGALGLLFGAIAQGLLGSPDMQITGNGSFANDLHWFQDRHDKTLPTAWVLSVSIWFYRLLMLLWAMWLANALLGWLRWGWAQFTAEGLWKKAPVIVKAAKVGNGAREEQPQHKE